MISCEPCSVAAPACAAPESRPPPATIAPMPSIIAMIAAVCAVASCSRSLRQMTAGDVTGLMREHADDLVRRRRFHQRADIDEDAPRVDDEGVEGFVRDQHDLDILLAEIGGAQDRLGVVAQQLLDFGVANDGQPGFSAGLRLRGPRRRTAPARRPSTAASVRDTGLRGARLIGV